MLGRACSLLALLLAVATPSLAAAQETLCVGETGPEGLTQGIIENGQQIYLVQGPGVYRCPDGVELRAYSGRIETGTRTIYLLGDVFFQDSTQTLTAREATYNPDDGRLWARGDVVYSDRRRGSTLRGPELVYLRATETRPLAQMTATGRPVLVMPAAEGAESGEPLELTANRVEMLGDNQLSAFGDVVITRADLRATSGEARYNSSTEELALRSSAFIRSQDYELTGDTIDARMNEGAIEFIQSRTGAILQGDELRVAGDDLQLQFRDDLLQRVVARVFEETGSRAVATSRTFQLTADSLDALFIDQRLEQVQAIGNAYGESIDTTTVAAGSADEGLAATPALSPAGDADGDLQADPIPADILARDWIRGDTIIGYFVAADTTGDGAEGVQVGAGLDGAPGAAGVASASDGLPGGAAAEDPASANDIGAVAARSEDDRPSVQLERLVAIGGAQSLYRMSESGVPGARNVNFLVGRRITLEVAEGELRVATIEGLQYGVYLEANARTAPTDAVEPNDGPPAAGEPAPDQLPSPPGGA